MKNGQALLFSKYLFLYPLLHVTGILLITVVLTPILEWTFYDSKKFFTSTGIVLVTLSYFVHIDVLLSALEKTCCLRTN